MIQPGYGSTDGEIAEAINSLASYPGGGSPFWAEIVALYRILSPEHALKLTDAERWDAWQRSIDLGKQDDECWARKFSDQRAGH